MAFFRYPHPCPDVDHDRERHRTGSAGPAYRVLPRSDPAQRRSDRIRAAGLDGVRAAKLGYAIRADQWGRGYATDAARTLVNYGFEQLDLHRISTAIGPDNAPSIALVQRLGFQYEGRIRDHVYTNGAWRDSLLYSLLAPEWNHAWHQTADIAPVLKPA